MRLEVIDRRNATGADRIDVKYSAKLGVTTVTVDCDAVTLGIAAKVLADKFASYKATLEPDIAQRLETVITEVLQNG